MKKALWQWQGRTKGLRGAVGVALLSLAGASAQLAITEVMSWAVVTKIENQSDVLQSDWWELTNFGPDEIDLNDYYWNENKIVPIESFKELVIGPGKSIILFRAKETPTKAAFCEWWNGCLGTNLQEICMWEGGFGLDEKDDFVRLYVRLKDGQDQLVDSVKLGPAQRGKTFVSDPKTGEFGVYSELGDECGSCKAATSNDIGSPGTAFGPVKLQIFQQPSNLVVCAGSDAMLSVHAGGLPRPKYQWLHNGVPIPGATTNQCVITDAKLEDAGEYQVVISNGLERVQSTFVTLTLNTNPCPPQLVEGPSDQVVIEGETARLSASVCALPRPQLQWQSNRIDLVGETNRTLVIPNAALEASGTIYTLSIWNTLGSTNASARLFVQSRPTLMITEVMPAPLSYPELDWWELTNVGTNACNLKGFRYFDGPKLSGARVVTDNVVIQPGESVIFVCQLTRDEFIRWWGKTNLPPGLQVITWVGFGLDNWSDVIHVWSAAEESDSRMLASKSYTLATQYPDDPLLEFPPNLFGHPLDGHSLFFDTNETDAFWGQGSEENEYGAFRAETSADVGSPGFYVLPRCFGIDFNESTATGSTVTLRWRVVKGKRYQVESRPEVETGVWTATPDVLTASGSTLTNTLMLPPGMPCQFYRLRELR